MASPPKERLTFLGFGEAAQAFAEGMADRRPPEARGFDLKSVSPDAEVRRIKAEDFARFNVTEAASGPDALAGASLILSLVTAAQSLAAAQGAAATISAGPLFLDGNSVSPQTKRAAAAAIEAGGGRYVDVAIMSPVRPALTAAPLLVGGPHAPEAAERLTALGFSKVRVVDGPVGAASAVKMIRSVMVKGIEALTAECLSAAVAAGVDAEVIASLDASAERGGWASRGDYNLDRMMVHGVRRAEEMREVVATLEGLGINPAMTRGTVAWQAAVGEAGLAPPAGYDAKITLIAKTGARP